jgi:hypothetical protein
MALGLHPCVTKATNLQALLEVNLVEGEFLSEDVYELLNFGMRFMRSNEGQEYWYDLNPKPFGFGGHVRGIRPWSEEDRKKIEAYLGDYTTQQPPEEDIWL